MVLQLLGAGETTEILHSGVHRIAGVVDDRRSQGPKFVIDANPVHVLPGGGQHVVGNRSLQTVAQIRDNFTGCSSSVASVQGANWRGSVG